MTNRPNTIQFNLCDGERTSKSLWKYTNKMKLNNGSNYTGYIDRFGKRVGLGTWTSPSRIYDFFGKGPQLSWTEYFGQWLDDQPNGFGCLRNIKGDGKTCIIYEGIWINGVPETSAVYRS